MNKLYLQTKCPSEVTVQILSNKWAIPIIKELMKGPLRPSDLERILKGLSAKTLAERLHDLKEWKIISRRSYPEVPPRVEYSLTPLGRKLDGVLQTLADYGSHWQESIENGSAGQDLESTPLAEPFGEEPFTKRTIANTTSSYTSELFDLEPVTRT